MANKRTPAPEVIELQTAIFTNRLGLSAVMKEAGIAASTWARWANGADPKASNLASVRAAIERLSNA